MSNPTLKERRVKYDRTFPRRKKDRERFERIILITHSILSVKFQDKNSRVGIRQLLNRILSLIQDHAIILILDNENKTKKDEYLRVIFHTMHDPAWKYEFEKSLRKNGGLIEDGCILIPKDRFRNIYNFSSEGIGEKYLSFIHMEFDEKSYSFPEFKFYDNERLDEFYIRDFLEDFRDEKSSLQDWYSSEILDKKISSRSENWVDGEYQIIEADIDDEYHVKKSEALLNYSKNKNWEKDFYNYHLKKIKPVFDNQYKKIYDSPLLNRAKNPLPNIVFSIRMFSRNEKRFKGISEDLHYTFDDYTLIPESQKHDIKTAFFGLKKTEKNYFSGADDFFWKAISYAQDENSPETDLNIDTILQEIQSASGSGVRTLTDSVLSGGFLRVSKTPFDHSGFRRLDKGLWVTKEEERQGKPLSLEYRKTVYNHYLTSMMFSGHKAGVLLAPVHITGSPWCTMSFLFDREHDLGLRKKYAHQRWLDCHHFCQDIVLLLIPSIRRQLKELYLNEISNLYFEMLKFSIIEEGLAENTQEEIVNILNSSFHMLTRIYPFDGIELIKISNEENNVEHSNSEIDKMYTILDIPRKKPKLPTLCFYVDDSTDYYQVVTSSNKFFISNISNIGDVQKYISAHEIVEKLNSKREEFTNRRKNGTL